MSLKVGRKEQTDSQQPVDEQTDKQTVSQTLWNMTIILYQGIDMNVQNEIEFDY